MPSSRTCPPPTPTSTPPRFEHEVAPNDLLALSSTPEPTASTSTPSPTSTALGYNVLAGQDAGTYNTRPNHQYGAINYRGANGTSHYDALNVRFNANNLQRVGLQLSVNYTLSHALDNLSSTFSESAANFNLGYTNPYAPGLDYGNADFDIRQRVSIGGIYQPTFLEFRGNRYAHAIAGLVSSSPPSLSCVPALPSPSTTAPTASTPARVS